MVCCSSLCPLQGALIVSGLIRVVVAAVREVASSSSMSCLTVMVSTAVLALVFCCSIVFVCRQWARCSLSLQQHMGGWRAVVVTLWAEHCRVCWHLCVLYVRPSGLVVWSCSAFVRRVVWPGGITVFVPMRGGGNISRCRSIVTAGCNANRHVEGEVVTW